MFGRNSNRTGKTKAQLRAQLGFHAQPLVMPAFAIEARLSEPREVRTKLESPEVNLSGRSLAIALTDNQAGGARTHEVAADIFDSVSR